jgi:two-component system OmpR family response regulator
MTTNANSHDAIKRHHTEIKFGVLRLDFISSRAELAGQPLKLLPREWAVLVYLLNHAGKLVSKEQILGAITERGETPSVKAIEVYISRLRTKLADTGIHIRTVRGLGYLVEESAGGGIVVEC